MTTLVTVDSFELLQLRLKVHGEWIEDDEQTTSLSDGELVRRTYALAGYMDDPLSDQFYRLVGEVIERFAPEAEWAELVRSRTEDYGEGSKEYTVELEGDRAGLDRRAALRREAQGGDDA